MVVRPSRDEIAHPSRVVLHQDRFISQAGHLRSLGVDVLGDRPNRRLVGAHTPVSIDSQEGMAVRALEVCAAARPRRFTPGERLDLLAGDGLHIRGREHIAGWVGGPGFGHREENHASSKEG
jgi:hypothetical protein